MDDLKVRIDAFVKHVEEVFRKNHEVNGFSFPQDMVRAEHSAKWCKLVRYNGNSNEGVYAFVALQDFTTKHLGNVKAGDIHLPASWKAPAKHARGNVFQEDFNKCAGPYGITYLR